MASLAERPSGAAPQTSTAPTLTTDRLPAATSAPPPATTPAASPWPNEDYRGWASL